MTQLPFPGLVSEQQRLNLESVEYKDPRQYLFIEFTGSIFREAHTVLTLPKQSVVVGPTAIRVRDPFTVDAGVIPWLFIGVENDPDAIGKASLGTSRSSAFIPGVKFGHLFDTDVRIFIHIGFAESSIFATKAKGKAWFILEWINVNRIR